MRIFLIGFMGSGKTHWGNLLSRRLQLPFFDLDEVIIAQENRGITDIFAESGEEYFRLREKEILENMVNTHPSLVLSCGGGTPCFFNNIDYMKKEGTVVWLNTSMQTLWERLKKEKAQRPLLKNIDDDDLRGYILKKMNDRRLYYEQADVHVLEDSANMDTLIQQIMHA